MRGGKRRISPTVAVCLAICLATAGVAVAAIHTKTFSSGNVSKFIGGTKTTVQTIAVRKHGKVKDVDAYVRINHSFDADVNISLLSPNGTLTSLSSNDGAGGANFGSGARNCSGLKTKFDDEANTPIGSGSAPFPGSYKPVEPLSALDGTQMHGKWMFIITDNFAPVDDGRLYCAKVKIRYKT